MFVRIAHFLFLSVSQKHIIHFISFCACFIDDSFVGVAALRNMDFRFSNQKHFIIGHVSFHVPPSDLFIDSIFFFSLQGAAKHFIPHNAITCSIVSDDVVACVLLLYNPATKCPLHVHAYRCDSAATAHALHDQLQILIKKPENQKRFAELESKWVELFFLLWLMHDFHQHTFSLCISIWWRYRWRKLAWTVKIENWYANFTKII